MTKRAIVPRDRRDVLSPRVQRWIRKKKKWPELRPIQNKVIPELLDELRESRQRDFVISAPTASGKTEAVFLPIATILDGVSEPQEGADVLYICPLVALINQQTDRLGDGLIDPKRYAVTPWHARAATAGKRRFEAKPGGVLVITPESLESMFINRAAQLEAFFARLRCIVVDEFHAFFNSPRGVQLISQLNRIDLIAKRKVPRLALSATFNPATEKLVQEHLRPADPGSVMFLRDDHLQHELRFTLHAYPDVGDPAEVHVDRQREDIASQAYLDFRDLHATETGGEKAKGLIFVNSRKEAEFFSHRLNELAADDGHEVSFFPHHGSLAPTERKEAETAIQDPHVPAVIVCTSTLELGIDIGMITQVGQVDPGNSVSSLHQRLGRSGRRHGQVGILIMYVRDADVRTRSSPLAELHLPTFQALAQISLVEDKAYEPPDRRAAHLSTLIQQILSLAAQQNGFIDLHTVREVLVETGPFYALRENVDEQGHLALLFARLEQYELLERESESEYRLTHNARKLMDDYRFFAAFQGGDDYRVQSTEGQHLGTVPSANLYSVGDRIIYARRTWTIVRISREMKIIVVTPSPVGQAPIFSGDPIPPSQAVVSRMEELFKGTVKPPQNLQLGTAAARLYEEGRAAYRRLQLHRRSIIEFGNGVLLLPWVEYRGQLSLVRTLRYWGANASSTAIAVFVEAMDLAAVEALLAEIAAGSKAPPEASEAMRAATSLLVDKHDNLLSPYLQRWNAGTFRLAMETVPATARRLLQVTATRSSGTPRPRPRRR